MSRFSRGLATVGLTTLLFPATIVLVDLAGGRPLSLITALVVGLSGGFAYGLLAGILGSYDLGSAGGVGALIVDATWSLPNTALGLVVGAPFYCCFGSPSRAESQGQGWVVFKARGTTGFGHDVLQTLGTVNLGGAGNHERVHLLQARICGPLYVPVQLLSYVVTSIVQAIWTITVGLILWATKVRPHPWFSPPARSAVKGFFGWIYYFTLFEIWAYGTEP